MEGWSGQLQCCRRWGGWGGHLPSPDPPPHPTPSRYKVWVCTALQVYKALAGRPGSALGVGSWVTLSDCYQDCRDGMEGPLQPGQIGTVVEEGSWPHHVQVSGKGLGVKCL